MPMTIYDVVDSDGAYVTTQRDLGDAIGYLSAFPGGKVIEQTVKVLAERQVHPEPGADMPDDFDEDMN